MEETYTGRLKRIIIMEKFGTSQKFQKNWGANSLNACFWNISENFEYFLEVRYFFKPYSYKRKGHIFYEMVYLLVIDYFYHSFNH